MLLLLCLLVVLQLHMQYRWCARTQLRWQLVVLAMLFAYITTSCFTVYYNTIVVSDVGRALAQVT
jgi:hypothetical protein